MLLDKMLVWDRDLFGIQHILPGLIISSTIVLRYLECSILISLELVRSVVCFDWVFKVLKCHQFTVKERNGEIKELFPCLARCNWAKEFLFL
jgi:hypothetical protein